MAEGNKDNRRQDSHAQARPSDAVRMSLLFACKFLRACLRVFLGCNPGEIPSLYLQEFDVGAAVSCKATFDNQQHPASVIEKRQEDDKGWLYYVHYAECETTIMFCR